MNCKIEYCNNVLKITSDSFEPIISENSDFWRIHLDCCKPCTNRELGVYSHQQIPSNFKCDGSNTIIEYDNIVSEDGVVHNIQVTLKCVWDGEAYNFSAEIINNSDVRVNELQYPMFQFDKINEELCNDVLYIPQGLGMKIKNPHKYVLDKHTEYMSADYKNVKCSFGYPGKSMSMPWMSVVSGQFSMYMGRHSDVCRLTNFVLEAEPREQEKESLIYTISSFPAVNPTETLKYDGFYVAFFDGDWRKSADFYRQWADESWYSALPRNPMLRNIHGWQRIIMKHQYGEIFHTFDELPKLFSEGKKYGINMILLFGWWREGMDNGYPDIYPDEMMGGAGALKDAITEINNNGGIVILYANGHLIDISSDYYKTQGYKYTMKDIDLNDYREHYKFSNNGTLLDEGNKSFACGCFGTNEWVDKLLEIENRHISLGSNGTFFDQIGTQFYPCFDSSHSHGNRIDEDPHHRINAVKKMREVLKKDELFGTEWVFDRVSSYMDFTHGCGWGSYFEDSELLYPHIFKYTFPEIISTNRFIHDEKAGWKRHLNFAFVYNLLFDVSGYRCRAKSIEQTPNLATYIKEIIDLRKKYINFFYDGKYNIPDISHDERVHIVEYSYNDDRIWTIWNDSESDFIIPTGDNKGEIIQSGNIGVCEFMSCNLTNKMS